MGPARTFGPRRCLILRPLWVGSVVLRSAFFSALSVMALSCSPTAVDWVPGVVYLVPIGEPEATELARAEKVLALLTQRPVRRLPRRPLLPAAVHPHCPTAAPCYDAGSILDELLSEPPRDTFRIVGITEAPISSSVGHDSIAFARRHERALLYTTVSLRPLPDAQALARTRQIMSHELGHTFGAQHCSGPCLMQPRLEHRLATGACPLHRPLLVEGLAQSIAGPTFLAAVGRERGRLGDWNEAIDAYRRSLRRRPRVVEVEAHLALALVARGRHLEAEDVLDQASYNAPDSPLPFYVRAGLFATQDRTQRAAAHLESGVNRDPNPTSAHRLAGIVYQDVLRDESAAIYHFRLHLSAGGRDPEVLGRLAMLLTPTTLLFTEPEVVVVRWDVREGLLLASAGWGQAPGPPLVAP